MRGFSADWLALREPLDAAARCRSLGTAIAQSLNRTRPSSSRVAVIDLGAGTGANLRYAAALIGGAQDWLLVDNDAALLGAVAAQMRARLPGSQVAAVGPKLVIQDAQFECQVQCVALDLAARLQQLPLGSGALLTASALLDLVSEQWLRALVQRAADAGVTVWFALTYDGRIDCDPAEPEDVEVRELINLHQLNDKGFGAALGPAAVHRAQQILVEHGYQVQCAPSDWHVGPAQGALQHALVDGWCHAAVEIAPHRAPALHGWLARRRAHIEAARSELHVGHIDMIGRLAEPGI